MYFTLIIQHTKEIGTSCIELVHIVTGASSDERVPETRETRSEKHHDIPLAYERVAVEKIDTMKIISKQEIKVENLNSTLMKKKIEVMNVKKSSLQNKENTTKLSSPLSPDS